MAKAKETAAAAIPAVKYENRLKKRYKEEIIPALIKTFNYENVMQVPKVDKIILNMRLGDVKDNAKSMQLAINELETIAGQKAVVTKAKKSVANFKVRENMSVGAKVTLRGTRMWDFLDKLVSIALPRVRDFRGVSPKAFDGRGNYAIGVKEQLIFPEISYDQVEKVRGFDVCVVTTANTDEEAKELLKQIGMPFSK
ncbi:MAG: 50S ribosomal protein L5 [Clostridia bacterium]|nr:50S ribosomal protein L5 [Clostridia bacterium]